MPEVRLGAMHLRWCDACDVHVLEERACGICGTRTRALMVTPPGDIRPGFEADIRRIGATIDASFGPGTGAALLPEGHIVLLNKSPHIDRMDEVIVDGRIVGIHVHDPEMGRNRFLPSAPGARILAAIATKARVTADAGAVKPIGAGGSLLGPGVLMADDGIAEGDEALVLGPDGAFLAAGRARMSTATMRSQAKGIAVRTRVREKGDAQNPTRPQPRTWDDAIAANKKEMAWRKAEATEFIKHAVKKHALPVAVSLSGGKDSLATLLLVMDAGIQVPMKAIFIDTGLELPETVANVRSTADRFGLDLAVSEVGDRFWRSLPYFGPPAKDYRWCCKTCKLGPVAGIISDNFPDGVLTFIGQRAYESMGRAGKGPLWRNPWVPGQVGASPIQEWTALHVWLLLLEARRDRGIEINPWYERGLDRVGCWLCPASDIADLDVMKEHFSGYSKWEAYLKDYAAARGYDDVWLKAHLWRWRRLPKGLQQLEPHFLPDPTKRRTDITGPLEFRSAEGYQPCVGGFSIEGAFNRPLDLERIEGFLNTIGPTERDTTSGTIRLHIGDMDEAIDIEVWGEGALVLKGPTQDATARVLRKVTRAIARAEDCVGCGICIARCKMGALSRDKVTGRAAIDKGSCSHCSECDDVCPITDLDPGKGFEL
jgi:phosphoadenosine phosphosulfate reductase